MQTSIAFDLSRSIVAEEALQDDKNNNVLNQQQKKCDKKKQPSLPKKAPLEAT